LEESAGDIGEEAESMFDENVPEDLVE